MPEASTDMQGWYNSLDARTGPSDALSWLRESWSDPAPFWAALFQHNRIRTGLPLVSVPGSRYQLAHDLLLRNRGSSLAVLRWFDSRLGWQVLTWAELIRHASALALSWRQRGLEPGQTVALILPFGPEYVTALSACLLLGVRTAFLPPGGESWLTQRLETLNPTRIVTRLPRSLLPKAFQGEEPLEPGIDDDVATPPPDWPRAMDSARGDLGTLAPPTLGADEPAWLTFPTRLEPIDLPIPIPAEAALLYPMRDGFLAFGLEPGDHLAAPGFHPLQHQPALLLSAMAWGATYVHLELDDVARDPSLLEQFPLKCLGMTKALRDSLLAGPGRSLRGLQHWFTSPEEPVDTAQWSRFIDTFQLKEIPVSHQLIDAAWGGCLLSSMRRRGMLHRLMLAPAGVPWTLQHLPDGQTPPADRAALFAPGAPFDRPPSLPPHLLMVRQEDELFYGTPLAPRSLGRVYPEAEVLHALDRFEGLVGATIVPEHGGSPGTTRFTLLAFTGSTGPEPGSSPALTLQRELEARIRTRLTPDHLPDRIVLVPLFPRRDGKGVDVGWCRYQLESGLLARKIDHPAYRALTRLRGVLERASAPRPAKQD